MIYFKSLLTGLVAAVIAVVVWVFVNIAISLVWSPSVNEGSGGIGVIVMSGDIYLAAIFGLAMGVYWQFQRLRRRAAHER